MSKKYLTTADVADRYGVSVQTIYRLVADGRFPTAIAVGRQLRWLESSLDSWDAKQVANAGATQ